MRVLVCFAVALLFQPTTFAVGFGESLGISPFLDWKTIETEHFRISYPDELSALAPIVAGHCEDANTLLSEKLYWKPKTKIQVILLDNADAANGLATASLRQGMILYLTPPDNWFSTSSYEDWLRLLVLHEYTHILNTDVTDEWAEVLRIIFGDGVRLNSFWPRWMLEGLAVYMETRLTRGGRGRSTLYEAVLRSLVLEQKLDTREGISLDRINGPTPYAPGGEIPYLFGFYLMNQIATDPDLANRVRTFDMRESVKEPDQILGRMSRRSGSRIPYFINDNLTNLTGKDWYSYWDDFVRQTYDRMDGQLKTIKKQPVTSQKTLTASGSQVRGSCFSSDGQNAAFIMESLDETATLYHLDLETQKPSPLEIEILGSTCSFIPQTDWVLISSLKRSKYSFFSELRAVNIKTRQSKWLTDGIRARDPNVSSDGSKAVFTLTKDFATGIGSAEITLAHGIPYLEKTTPIFQPASLDRASTPILSPDGSRVVFSFHKNGSPSEELMDIDFGGKNPRTLVKNGAYNRFPVFSPAGELFFISDKSGVDNLYRLETKGPRKITNMLTGLWFPSFSKKSSLYGSVLGASGWDLATLDFSQAGLSDEIKVSASVAAPFDKRAEKSTSLPGLSVSDYSIFPSIYPRSWSPVLYLSQDRTFLGAAVSGYDATDRHSYLLQVGYDTLTKKPEGGIAYSNRSLGPILDFFGTSVTNNINYAGDTFVSYEQEAEFGVRATYPILHHLNTWIPSVSWTTENDILRAANSNSTLLETGYHSALSATLGFQNIKSSSLSIVPEQGRILKVGAKNYFLDSKMITKGIFEDKEHFTLIDHVVLVPRARAAWTSSRSTEDFDANVVVKGRNSSITPSLITLSADQFETFGIRGYPTITRYARQAFSLSSDLFFPIVKIYRGWGTNPIYLKDFYGFIFGETNFIPKTDRATSLTLNSAGAGFRITSDVLVFLPLTFSAEYHHGFNKTQNGKGELIATLLLGSTLY